MPIAKKLAKVCGGASYNLLQNNGRLARKQTQCLTRGRSSRGSCPFPYHVIKHPLIVSSPRTKAEGLEIEWNVKENVSKEELAESQKSIVEAVKALK